MALALLVPQCTAIRLRHIAAGIMDVYAAESLEDLEATICGLPIDVVILDPAADGTMRIDEASALVQKYPSLYFILYMALRPASVSTVLHFSKVGVRDVLTQGVDDSPTALREKLERLECTALTRTNLRTMIPRLADTSPDVVQIVERMFEAPQRYACAADLARDACIPLSRLYRTFEISRLPSPRQFLIAAKVWHGYSYLRQSRHSVRHVAKRLGYMQPRIFVSHVMMVFGVPPSVIRTNLPLGVARDRVRTWLAEADARWTPEMHLEARGG